MAEHQTTSGENQGSAQGQAGTASSAEGLKVTVAQCQADVLLNPPAAGERVVVKGEPGQSCCFDLPDIEGSKVSLDGNTLTITLAGGGEIVLENFIPSAPGILPSAMCLADGTVIETADLILQSGSTMADVSPAFGDIAPGAGGLPGVAPAGGPPDHGGGAGFKPFTIEIPEFTPPPDPLPPTELGRTPPEPDPVSDPPEGEAAPDTPPEADPVETPAETEGEIPSGLALLLLATEIPFAFKQLDVNGEIGDDDNFLGPVDIGGADAETALGDLVFTYNGDINYGTVVLESGGVFTILSAGDTFTSADTIWWLATESQVAAFLEANDLEVLPPASFTYSVTDEAGNVADAPVVITFEAPPPPTIEVTPETEVPPDGEGDVVPPGTTPNGEGFEDWQPNQHVGDPTEAPTQLVFTFTPQDSQVLTSVVISGIPSGVKFFVGGTDPGDEVTVVGGEVTILAADLGDVFILPVDDDDSDIPLTVTANFDSPSGSGSVSIDTTVVIDAAADKPAFEFSIDDGEGGDVTEIVVADDGSVTFNLETTFGDFTDGSEVHTIVISGVPSSWTLTGDTVDGSFTNNFDGTYTLVVTGETVSGTVTFDVDDSEGPFEITFTAIATETNLSGGELTTINNEASMGATLLVTVLDDTPRIIRDDDTTVDEDDLVPDGSDQSQSTTVMDDILVDFGADAPGTVVLSTDGLAALGLTSGTDTIEYFLSGDGLTITAKIGADSEGIGGTTIFTVAVNNAGDSDDTTFKYTFTLEGPIDHDPGDGQNTEPVTFKYIATDSDSDSVEGSFVVTITDDVPAINSIVDAIIVNEPVQVVNGTYDADFGADGLDFLTLALGDAASGFTYATSDAGGGVTQVDVTVGAVFTFYYTTSTDPDGSTELVAFFDAAMTTDPFFTLTVETDGTYVFTLLDNSVLTDTTIDFGDIPRGNFDFLDLPGVLIDSIDPDGNDQSVNTSAQGLGVGVNTNIEQGEKVTFKFDAFQKDVSFDVTKWTGNLTFATLTLVFFNASGEFLTREITLFNPGGNNSVTVDIEQSLTPDPILGDALVLINGEFIELHVIIKTMDGNTQTSVNLDNLTFGLETVVEDFTVQFDLTVTDGDGDSDTLDNGLVITLDGNDVTAGLILTGSPDGEILMGGSGPDTLNGNGGDDILIGGGGADKLFGGAGDDTLVFDSIDTEINGGADEDTLQAEIGSGDAIDLVAFAGTIESIEVIDLESDAGANTLTLVAQDVLDISDTDTVTVFGDGSDTVVAGSGWTDDGAVGGFHTYSQGLATLIVDDTIDQSGITA